MKPNMLEDTLGCMIHELAITPLVAKSHRMQSKGSLNSKMTIRLPCVEFEKKPRRPLTCSRKDHEVLISKPIHSTRSNSFSKIIIRKPVNITPHLVEMSFEDHIQLPLFKCKRSNKRLKSRRIHTSKERCLTEPFDSTLPCKVSNVIIPLPYTENKNLELKRSAHRLHKLQRRLVKFDKENESFN